MSKGSAKPPIAGKPMTVVFDEDGVDAVARIMRRAKFEARRRPSGTQDRSSRNAAIVDGLKRLAELENL